MQGLHALAQIYPIGLQNLELVQIRDTRETLLFVNWQPDLPFELNETWRQTGEW